MKYYRGNFLHERHEHHGWFVGHFMPRKDSDLRTTSEVEVKFWTFKQGETTGHTAKHLKTATEYSFILKGKIRGNIGSESVTLVAGEYVIIPPGVVSNFPTEVVEDAEGLTLKTPSVPRDKVEVPESGQQ